MAVTSCVGWVEPLNLQCWLVNIFSGSMNIFVFVAFLAIAMLGAKFRMLNGTLLLMFALFGMVMAQFATGIYFLIILIGGLVAAVGIKRLQTSQ